MAKHGHALRISALKRQSAQTDLLGLLWQELAETVARAQRLANEHPRPAVKPEPHR
jgi:hypothetical protein